MMMSEETVSGAVAAVLSGLARPNSLTLSTDGVKTITLPGPDSVQKTLLESELTSLSKRIQELEIRAHGPNSPNLPVTPNEPGSAPILSSQQSKAGHSRKSSRESQATWVNNLLTARPKSSTGEPPNNGVSQLTDAQLDQIRDHVNRQSEEIQTQRAFIENVSTTLAEQRRSTQNAVEGLSKGLKQIDALKRELAKHQQANTAFQKALREIGNIVTCVADGDLSKKVLIHSKELDPEITTFKKTINRMVDQLQEFALQVTNLAREVGTDGVLGGQAAVPGVSGIWLDLQSNVNIMATNLTEQVREIAVVTTAVAHGDLSRKIERPAKGEILALQSTINVMVDQLRVFATEVTRVSRDVGTEGVLGGQAQIPGVRGAWRELTENVNAMANNLTTQVRDIAKVTKSVAKGDLTQHVSAECKGEILELKSTINSMVDQLSQFAQEVTILAQEVGTEGRLGGQATVHGVSGTWESLTLNVNAMANNLTTQVREIAEVTTAVAKGDLTKMVTADVKGEILELKITINSMVERLRTFGFEVSKVAREVGTDGTLGGQARVEDVDGLWRQITENVNTMANNLTMQVRNISDVTQAIARGDMSRRIHVSAQGEILHLKNTINNMVDRLDDWSQAVSRVARDVGVDGKMGGQAHVIGLEGRWKLITTDVNIMAQNLTQQVRAFADITNAANSGDFTQEITIAASGEMDELKRKINKMVSGLRESIEKNTKAREAAEAANKTKSEFLANMSHEIRTPMNGIIGMTQLTLDSELTTYQRDMLNTVHQLANSLLTIIDDILDISKIEANRMDIERIPFSVRGMVFNSLKTLVVRANERGLALNYEVDNTTPDYVLGDSFRLRQIIVNLVGNAIKFTEQGFVLVKIEQTHQEGCTPGEYRMMFSVRDTGIGIRQEKRDVIFETFQQADGSMTRRFGGTGLGLSISKRLVTLMGGEMWVVSQYGRGSTFFFTCKVRLANNEISTIKPSLHPYKNHTVLFLDEGNTGCSEMISSSLKELDLVPVIARPEDSESLPELRSNSGAPYDCILVDNIETARRLRKFDRYKFVPLILLSSHISVSFKSALEDGVSGYMTTPCQPIDLANALIPALEGKATPLKSDHSRSFDILLAEDNHVNQKLAVKILQKYHHNVTVANNGLEALQAVQQRAFDVVLMDVQMPVMGGFEATMRIREWEIANHVDRTPILALTAHAMLGDREKCLQADMDDYLSKPLKQAQLIQCILKYATMSGAMLENKNKARRSLLNDNSAQAGNGPLGTSANPSFLKRPGLDQRGMSEMIHGLESPAIVTAEQGDPLERVGGQIDRDSGPAQR